VPAASPRKVTFDAVSTSLGESLSFTQLKVGLRAALGESGVALCLHRVAPLARSTDWQPQLNISPSTLDELVELLLESRPRSTQPWLELSFDDGYEDARAYIESRAAIYPQVRFVFFVCPDKLEKRAGFRWDVAEQGLAREVLTRTEAIEFIGAPASLKEENKRADLKALADTEPFVLASVQSVRDLLQHPNVELGNHTNLHLRATGHPDALVQSDYRHSTEQFERLFGPQRHFAFPFGTPAHHFHNRHVQMLRALGDFTIWTTEARPFSLAERRPGAVLPRFPVEGDKSTRAIAGWLMARAARARVTKPRALP
jgi:hypothetical protein